MSSESYVGRETHAHARPKEYPQTTFSSAAGDKTICQSDILASYPGHVKEIWSKSKFINIAEYEHDIYKTKQCQVKRK